MYSPRGSYKRDSPMSSPLGCKPKFRDGLCGFLFKHDLSGTKWHERFFVMDGSNLSYYMGEDCSELKGSYTLNSKSIFTFLDYTVGSHSFIFTIEAENKEGEIHELYLSAATNNNRHVWHEAFKEAVNGGRALFHIPEIWPNSIIPMINVEIEYPSGAIVDDGNILEPNLLVDVPSIKYSLFNSRATGHRELLTAKHRYTMILVDLDFPADQGSKRNKYIQWMTSNIILSDPSVGEEVIPYHSPAPTFKSGFHRFFFLLYRQDKVFSSAKLKGLVDAINDTQRHQFDLRKWLRHMKFEAPIGVNGFHAEWEEHCDHLHDKNGVTPPRMHLSPRQEQERSSEIALQLFATTKQKKEMDDADIDKKIREATKKNTNVNSLNPSVMVQKAASTLPVAARGIGAVPLHPDEPYAHPHTPHAIPPHKRQQNNNNNNKNNNNNNNNDGIVSSPTAASLANDGTATSTAMESSSSPNGAKTTTTPATATTTPPPPPPPPMPPLKSALKAPTPPKPPINNLKDKEESNSSPVKDNGARGISSGAPAVNGEHLAVEVKNAAASTGVPFNNSTANEDENKKMTRKVSMGGVQELPPRPPATATVKSHAGGEGESMSESNFSLGSLQLDVVSVGSNFDQSSTKSADQLSPSPAVSPEEEGENNNGNSNSSIASALKKGQGSRKRVSFSGPSGEELELKSKRKSQQAMIALSSHEAEFDDLPDYEVQRMSPSNAPRRRNGNAAGGGGGRGNIGNISSSSSSSLTSNSDANGAAIPAVQSSPAVKAERRTSDGSASVTSSITGISDPTGSEQIHQDLDPKHRNGGDIENHYTSAAAEEATTTGIRVSEPSAAVPGMQREESTASVASVASTASAISTQGGKMTPSEALMMSSSSIDDDAFAMTMAKTPTQKGTGAVPMESASAAAAGASLSPRPGPTPGASISQLARVESSRSNDDEEEEGGGGGGFGADASSSNASLTLMQRVEAATTVQQLCQIFNIEHSSVFEGETLKKRFSKDIIPKDRFVWIEPRTKSIHWAKRKSEREDASKVKFFLLDKTSTLPSDMVGQESPRGESMKKAYSNTSMLSEGEFGDDAADMSKRNAPMSGRSNRADLAHGELTGVIHSATINHLTMKIFTDKGDYLSLQLPSQGNAAQRAKDWFNVTKALTKDVS